MQLLVTIGRPVRITKILLKALTADAFLETKEKCLLSGMQEVLTKPIQHKHLLAVMKRYL